MSLLGPSNMGMAAGIGDALSSAVSTFLQARNMMQENETKKMMANAQTATAFATLKDSTNLDIANRYGQRLGIIGPDKSGGNQPPPGLMSSQGLAPKQNMPDPSADPGGLMAGLGQVPGLTGPSQSGGSAYDQTQTDRIASMGKQQQEIEKQPILAAQQLTTKQGATEQEQRQAGLKNTQNQPMFELKTQYDNDKMTQNTKEAGLNLQKMLHADLTSPTAQQGLVFNYIKTENPGVVTEGSLKAMLNNPNLMQNYGDKIKQALTGSMTQGSINDMIRAGIGSYQGAREAHTALQQKYQTMASKLGVPGAFTDEPELTQLDKLASARLKKIGSYQSPLEQAATMAGNTKNGLGDKASGLMSNIKSMASGLMGNGPGPASSSQAPSSLSDKERSILSSELTKNPTGPRSAAIKQLLGVK